PPETKVLGCDPDFNAYSGKRNPNPEPVGTMRTGSGHLHIGWTDNADVTDESHLFDCKAVVKAMDSILIPVSKLWDKDNRREKMYGARGAFRPKPYGVEYRTMNNSWLNKPMIWSWLFDTSKAIVHGLERGNTFAGIEDSLRYY